MIVKNLKRKKEEGFKMSLPVIYEKYLNKLGFPHQNSLSVNFFNHFNES